MGPRRNAGHSSRCKEHCGAKDVWFQDIGIACLKTSEQVDAFSVGGCRRLVWLSLLSLSRVVANLRWPVSTGCLRAGSASWSPGTGSKARMRSRRGRSARTQAQPGCRNADSGPSIQLSNQITAKRRRNFGLACERRCLRSQTISPAAVACGKRRVAFGGQFKYTNFARGAVDLDERARRQRPGGTLGIHHTREPELAGHHGGM
jgi:hypothetical protein